MNRSVVVALASPAMVVVVYCGLWLQARATTPGSRALLTPAESSALWQRSKARLADGQYPEALAAVLKLHAAYPGNHIYLESAAEIYDRLGRYEEEAAFWEKYFDRAPNPVTACPQMGEAYAKQGKSEQALAAFERCLALDPDNSDSIFFLAQALERAGSFDRAAALYRRGLVLSPAYSDLQIGLARVLLHQGNAAAAGSTVAPVLRKSPRNVDALLVAGLVSEREGKLAQAKQYLQKGAALADGYLDFHAALAGIAEEEKDFPEAVRQYDRILRERPDDHTIRSRRDALQGQP